MAPTESVLQTELSPQVQVRQKHGAGDCKSSSLSTPPHDGVCSVRRPQDLLLSAMELPLRRTFYPLGFAVEILTNDPDVLSAANESFGHRRLCRGRTILQVRIGISEGGGARWPPEPTRREYSHLYSLVADGNNQALLDLKTCTSFMWLQKAALSNKLYFRYNFLEKVVYLLLGASVVTDIHSACVSRNGKGVLLCGDSGSGKSTLAYACARAGWAFTSDDTCYLINGGASRRVIGHCHRARFRPETKLLFPELENQPIAPRMEGKPSIEVLLSDLPNVHIRTVPEVTVHAIVYLNRHSSQAGRLKRLPAGIATLRSSQELFSAGEIREKHEAMLQIFADVPTYELEYHELKDGMRALALLT